MGPHTKSLSSFQEHEAQEKFGHFSIFGLVFFVLKSLLGIVGKWSCEKFAVLTLKPRYHDRILIYNVSNVGYWYLCDTSSNQQLGNASEP